MPGAGGRRAGGRAPHAGFTLIEIMVVVLIIGVVTAGVLLSINFAGKDTELETESKRLISLLDYARDQAELQTRNYGIVFSQHGYAFVVYDVRAGAWRQVSEDDALRERSLPRGLDFQLVVDARPIVLSDSIELPSTSPSDSKSGSAEHSRPVPPANPDSSADSSSDSASDSSSDSDSDSGAKSFAPQVMIFSSGDLSSFRIKLERASAGRSITLDENQDGNIVAKPMTGSGT